jgi:lysophospholipase L1-like esterase
VTAPYGATILYVAYITNNQTGALGAGVTGWTGLKWAAMGDSITGANNNRATKRYFDYISDFTGISVVNLGKSGTGYKKPYNNNLPFYQRIDTVPLDADVITIFGSGNDLSLTLGDPTDTTDATICGCINLTIDGIRDRVLGANLGIITPTPWVQYPTTIAGNKMDLYSDALVEICRLKSVPCLDLYHCSNMLPWDEAFRNAFYKHDDGNGVHPDEDGHKLFAPRIKAFLETLLM